MYSLLHEIANCFIYAFVDEYTENPEGGAPTRAEDNTVISFPDFFLRNSFITS